VHRFPVLFLISVISGLSAVRADDVKVRHPIIEFGEFEIDHNSTTTFDRAKSGKSNNQTHATEFEYGLFDWWKPGLEIATAAPTGENIHFDAFALENYFQLTPQGKYWADLTLFAEIEQPFQRGDPRSFTIGPLIQKEIPNLLFGRDTVHTLNVLYEKKWGPSNGDLSTMHWAWQSCALVHLNVNPCIEYFGDLGVTGQGEGPRHRLGPGVAGRLPFREFFGIDLPGGLKYETAYVFGLNDRTERGAIHARVEVELYAIRF
jgi:hypothetical protein